MSRTGLVIVSSTRAAAGEYEDRSGPIAVEFLRNQGLKTPDPIVVADADIFSAVEQALRSDDEPAVLLTSGGTGISPDVLTVEAIRKHLDKEMPGIAVAFWNKRSEEHTSELQSRGHLVCRLLLEKKKKNEYKRSH